MEVFSLVAMAIGAMINGAVTGLSLIDTESQIEKNKKREEALRDSVLAEMDLNFNMAKDEATKNADKADRQSDLNEKQVGEDVNNQIDALQLRQEKEANDFNNMAVQIGQAEGDSLSGMAASGTRTGGSMAEAVDLQKAMNMNQLQTEEDLARANDKITLANILNGLANNINGIQNDRTGAYDLRHSYDEGGDNYNLYKLRRDRTEKQYNDNIQDMQDKKDDINNNRFWYVLQGMFGGANKGLSVGQSLGRLSTDLGLDTKFKSTTGGNSTTNMQYSWINNNPTSNSFLTQSGLSNNYYQNKTKSLFGSL